ncbi:MAG: malate synthase A [Gemmatimonadota bacterium]
MDAGPSPQTARKADASPDPFAEILVPGALEFVAQLARRFTPAIDAVLQARESRRHARSVGERLDFRADTVAIRECAWRIDSVPADLRRRIIEITGPVDRKMIINALNSGADVFMADFEDATAPSWENVVRGQLNLRDAVRRTIDFTDPATGKLYALQDTLATLIVRPRGLHLPETHFTVDGTVVPGCLFDAGMYLFHNAHALLERGTGPYFYLPKLEAAEEAGIWNDVFCAAEDMLGITRGTIKATVLIETLPAVFQMHEILYALREHAVGLNCGRWDYIFSFIKTRCDDPAAVLPDRSQVGMSQSCMRAYTQLLIRTCHRRGAFAIGGMAAQIPVKRDPAADAIAQERVRADKTREVTDGHDGTWVAHPALVPVAREVFAAHMAGDNQLDRLREDVHSTARELLETPAGTVTEEGLRLNISVALQYIEAWLRGSGAVPLYNLMEDMATAEISRAQVWQWIRHGVLLADSTVITRELVARLVESEIARLRSELGAERMRDGRFKDATELFLRTATESPLVEFLTVLAYPLLARDGETLAI